MLSFEIKFVNSIRTFLSVHICAFLPVSIVKNIEEHTNRYVKLRVHEQQEYFSAFVVIAISDFCLWI